LNKWETIYNSITAVLGAFVGYLFGGWSVLLGILLAFSFIDYGSGMLASSIEGKLSSKVGFRGIAKKIMIFALVAVGHLVDKALGKEMIQNAIIFFYLGNELLSIIENAGRTGIPIPKQIQSAVEILKGKGE
jgi:toxin secretion/phage lysis holin